MSRLTPAQQHILENWQRGPAAVMGPAGSGKTFLIPALLADGLEVRGLSASRIHVLVPTHEAAVRVQIETRAYLQPETPLPAILTLTELCQRLQREWNPAFIHLTAISDAQRETLLDAVLQTFPAAVRPPGALSFLTRSFWPRDLASGRLPLIRSASPPETCIWWPLFEALPEILSAYQRKLTHAQLYDPATLIADTADFLQAHPAIQEQLCGRLDWLIQDDAHQSTPLEGRLLTQLIGPQTALLRLGDPHQRILSFLGADGQDFQDFIRRCPVFELQACQHSAGALSALLRDFTETWPEAFSGGPMPTSGEHSPELGWIWIKAYPSAEAEEAALIQACQTLLAAAQSVAVLCRTHRAGQELATLLTAAGLPVLRHHQPPEHTQAALSLLQDLLLYLNEPDDLERFQALMSHLGLSRTGLQLIFPTGLNSHELTAAAAGLLWSPELSCLETLMRACRQLRKLRAPLRQTPTDLLHWLSTEFSPEQAQTWAALQTLWQQSATPDAHDLTDFAHWLQQEGIQRLLRHQAEGLTCRGHVHILTIHRSGGLSWDAVLLPRLQPIRPGSPPEVRVWLEALRANSSPNEAREHLKREAEHEELRVIYRALSRARRHLLVSTRHTEAREQNRSTPSHVFQRLRNGYLRTKGG
jgi:superfamily I DNA/RNA helicase